MEFKKAEALISKYRSGEISEEERALLESWYLEEAAKARPEANFTDYQAEEAALWAKIQRQRMPQNQVRLWPRVAVAAAIALVLFAAGLFYFGGWKPAASNKYQLAADVNPGTTGATLVLNNGKRIRLNAANNGELAREAGVIITKRADGQILYETKAAGNQKSISRNTLHTNKGETFMVVLPDRSKVWLNSGSSLTYNTVIRDTNTRAVYLEGEAYFEIAKLNGKNGKRLPFLVITPKQEVEVLGTHFNINAYSDEPVISTALLEGSVKVSNGSGSKAVTLRPGELAINNGKNLEVTKTDLESIMDWQHGDFNLDKVDFKVSMRKIARWYNVEVIYDPSVPNGIETGGWISRKNKLSAVLKAIALSKQVKFRIQGRKVYVFKYVAT